LRCLNLLDPATVVAALRRRMGMVLQSINLFARLAALENLTVGPLRLLGVSASDARQKGMRLLQMVGLGDCG